MALSFIINENIAEQMVRLNKRYLDLISNGMGSSNFVYIQDTYGQTLCIWSVLLWKDPRKIKYDKGWNKAG